MTTQQGGDLELGKVLEVMCDRDDHVTVLRVLQTLVHIRRAGYMTVEEQVKCLSYCTNRFADSNHSGYFKEFVEYMPDITTIDTPGNPFTYKAKSCYFAYKHAKGWLDNLQTSCMLLDVDELESWFTEFVVSCQLTKLRELEPLYVLAEKQRELTNEGFYELCEQWSKSRRRGGPVMIRAGRT